MRILHCCLLILITCSPLYGDTVTRPSTEEIQKQITLLGDQAFKTRSAAQEQLELWSERHPRYLLTQLAEAYSDVEDVEIEIRLREMLKPLARLYLYAEPRGYLGVHLGTERIGNEITAVLIRRVLPGQAAEAAGLKDGDLILMLEGIPMDELGGQGGVSTRIAETMPGSVLELAVKRGEKEFLVRVIVGLRPMSARERAATVGSFEAQYLSWLESLRPDRNHNGMPIGHFPLGTQSPPQSPQL